MCNNATKTMELIENIKSTINKKAIDVHYEHVEIGENEYIYLYEICDLGISVSVKKPDDVIYDVVEFIEDCIASYERIIPKNRNEQKENGLFKQLYELYKTNIIEFKKLLKLNQDFTQYLLR